MRDGCHFVSGPNNCRGCPLAETATIGAKVGHQCSNMEWSVIYRLDDLGHTICEVTRR